MATTQAFWNTAGGDWFAGTNWDEADPTTNAPLHYVPGGTNDVIFGDNNSVTGPYTITYNGTDAVNSLHGTQLPTLAINGGSLTVTNATGTTSTINAIDLASGATLAVASSNLYVGNIGNDPSSSYSGLISGAGTIQFGPGTTALDTTTVTIAEVNIDGGNPGATVNLGNNLAYGGTFLDSGGFDTVNLQGNTLTLSGTTTLANGSTVDGPGTIDVTGHGMVGNDETFAGGAVLEDANSIIQNGDIILNATSQAPSTLQIDSGATYTLETGDTIAASGNIEGSAPSTVNDGTLTVEGTGTSTIEGTFAGSGTLSVASGATLNLEYGTDTIGGPVTGAGTLGIAAGSTTTIDTTNVGVAEIHVNGGSGGTTLDLGTNLTYGGMFLADGEFDSINLQGNTLTLSGTTTLANGSTFNGPGTIDVAAQGTVGDNEAFAGGIVLEDANSITQNGDILLNGTSQVPATLQIDSGATYTLETGDTIAASGNIEGSAPSTVNDGTLTVEGTGTSTIEGTFAGDGTLSVGSGATLILEDGTDTISGPVTGAGTLSLDSDGTTNLDTTNVSVAEIDVAGGDPGTTVNLGANLVYGGTFLAESEFDTINLGGHNLTLSGATTLDSAVALTGGSTLDLAGSVAGAGTISFASSGPTSTLEVDTAGEPANGGTFSVNLGNFGDDDELDLTGLTYAPGATATYAGGILSVTSDGTTEGFQLSDPGSTTFYAHQDAGTGTIVNDVAPVCFLEGTSIRTALGDVAIERLAVGDLVVTASCAPRRIHWLGHRTIDCRRHPRPREAMPVRISAHAFGPDRPSRDLGVSPGHSICVDVLGEVLIPAGALVDGTSVSQVEVDSVTYWHVELDNHDVILAENLPCESYLEMGNRGFFADSAVADSAATPDARAPAATHADFCRPFHEAGALVEAVRHRLRARADAAGARAADESRAA